MIHNLVAQIEVAPSDCTVTSHKNIYSYLYWDMETNYPAYQITIFQNYNLLELDQNDIHMRSKIYMTLLTHTEKFVLSLLQTGSFNNDKSVYYNNSFAVATKHRHNRPICSWQMCIKYNKNTIITQYSDIIALYALMHNRSYKQSVHILNDYIEQSRSLFNASQNKAGWFIQEKNPISIVDMTCFDDFTTTLEHQVGNIQCYTYKNKHGNPIAINIPFTNASGEHVNIFYTIQRRHDSAILYFAPLPPEPPYTMYNLENVTKNVNSVGFMTNESTCRISIQDQYIPITCPFGLSNLDRMDFSVLAGKKIYVDWDKKPLHEDFLLRLRNKMEEMNISLLFNYEYTYNIDINSLLKNKNFIIPLQDDKKYRNSPFSRAGEKILNQDRKRKTILDPIIESGTITWLFSKEKAGRTLIALSIAYSVGKGNKPVGLWASIEPMKVLYIDGEMPGDKIANMCDMIMRGYGDDSGYEGRPFDCYSFYEDNLDYDSILEEEWLEKYKKTILSYDLIILDNYYSLNENRINIRPFIKLLKEFTHRDVAVIVVDHTNTEGELQGSQVKRRATDLGIKLESLNENTLSIGLTFDRYGKSAKSPDFHMEKIFHTNQVKLIPTETSNAESKEDTKKALTERDKKILYSLILHKVIGVQQNIIAKYFNINFRRVNEYITSANSGISGTQPKKYKISDIDLFQHEYARITDLNKEDIQNEITLFCQDIE